MIDKQRLCSVENCGKPIRGHGWCSAHYQRWRNHGDPLGGGSYLTPAGEPMWFFQNVVLPYQGDDCLIWPYSRSGGGYGQMTIDGRRVSVIRLACKRRHGPPPTPKHEAAHSCGKGHLGCVNQMHLSWKMHAENMADKLVHGTHNRGERHASAKLTAAGVMEIRRRLAGGETQTAIAADVGVAQSAISRIHTRKSYLA